MVSGKGTYYASSVAYRTVNTVGMLIWKQDISKPLDKGTVVSRKLKFDFISFFRNTTLDIANFFGL